MKLLSAKRSSIDNLQKRRPTTSIQRKNRKSSSMHDLHKKSSNAIVNVKQLSKNLGTRPTTSGLSINPSMPSMTNGEFFTSK